MKKYYQLGKKLFPLNRSITGEGVRETLKILKKHIKDLKIKKIKSGTKITFSPDNIIIRYHAPTLVFANKYFHV